MEVPDVAAVEASLLLDARCRATLGLRGGASPPRARWAWATSRVLLEVCWRRPWRSARYVEQYRALRRRYVSLHRAMHGGKAPREQDVAALHAKVERLRRVQRAALVGEFAPPEQRATPLEERKHAHETFLGPATVPGRAVRARQVLYGWQVAGDGAGGDAGD